MRKGIYKTFQWLAGRELVPFDSLLIVRGMKRSVVIQAISYILVFLSSFLLVKTAGVENYGGYVNIFNWLTLFSVLACFGMEDVVLAEIPLNLKRNEFGKIKSLVRFANQAILIFSLVAIGILVLILSTGIIKGLQDHLTVVYLSLINVYLIAFIVVNQQILQAFNRFIVSQVADKIIKPFLIIMIIGGTYLVNHEIKVKDLVVINTLVLLICTGVVFYFVRNTVQKNGSSGTKTLEDKRLLKNSVYFLVISLLYLLNSRISMLIFGALDENKSVGILNIIYRFSDLVLLPFILIHNIVPQLFSSHTESDVAYKRKLFTHSNKLIAFSSGCILVVVAVFGKFVLELYDESLGQYYHILLILCCSQFFFSLFGPSSAFLMMQGKQRIAAILLLLNVAISSCLYYVSIRFYGINGAAWASFIGSLSYNLVLRIVVFSHLKNKEKAS